MAERHGRITAYATAMAFWGHAVGESNLDVQALIAAAGAFLDAITTKGAEPAFIHCAGGNRAATMWLIKRLAVDHWEVDRAVKEATALGQTNETLRTFAIE